MLLGIQKFVLSELWWYRKGLWAHCSWTSCSLYMFWRKRLINIIVLSYYGHHLIKSSI